MTTAPQIPAPPTEGLRVVQEVSRIILAIADQLQSNFAAHAAEFNVTAAQMKVLIALRPKEAVPMRGLADRLGYDPSNLTGLIDKLEARSAVERRPDSVDRRVKTLVLTREGLRLRNAFWKRITSDAGPLAHLSDDQLLALRDSLRGALVTDDETADWTKST